MIAHPPDRRQKKTQHHNCVWYSKYIDMYNQNLFPARTKNWHNSTTGKKVPPAHAKRGQVPLAHAKRLFWLNYCRKSYVLPKPPRCTVGFAQNKDTVRFCSYVGRTELDIWIFVSERKSELSYGAHHEIFFKRDIARWWPLCITLRVHFFETRDPKTCHRLETPHSID